ncbi:MAG: DUF2007 domain-containing protein [Planctomycetota bacterium]
MAEDHLVIYSAPLGDTTIFVIQETLKLCEIESYVHGNNVGLSLTAVILQHLVLRHREDIDAARRIVEEVKNKATTADPGLPWRCKKCGETSEPAFTACWNCGTDRDEW